MDAATQEAFERVIAQIKSHPLYLLAPPDAEAQLRAAIADGIDRREAKKIQAALDTPEERTAIAEYVQTLGIAKSDVDTLLRWLLAAVIQALEGAEPDEPTPPAPSDEAIDVSKVDWLYKGAKGYTVAAKATGKLDNLIRVELDKPLGPSCTLGIIILRDGVYYGGTIDGVGDNPTRINKTPNNIKGGSKGGPLIGRGGPKSSESASRAYLRLRSKETFWTYVQCDANRTRSTVVPMTWNQDGASAPAPTPETPKVNKGGDGLYKPETRLWLLPLGPKAKDINVAGEYRPGGALVKYLRIGIDAGARADGKQTPTDRADFYHNNRVVLRDSVVSANGNSLMAWTRAGRKYKMTVIDRNVRQEGSG